MESRWRRDHAEDGECMTHRQSPVPANTNALSLYFIFPHFLDMQKHAEKYALKRTGHFFHRTRVHSGTRHGMHCNILKRALNVPV